MRRRRARDTTEAVMALKFAPLLIVLAVVLAGCGGGSTRSTYGWAATATCLNGDPRVEGVRNDLPDLADATVRAAPGGYLVVKLTDAFAKIGFEPSTQAASDAAGGEAPADVKGNAVVVWDTEPSAEDRAAVLGCLR
jgi:hypothetical protein